jgi:hypothetical protein
MAAFVPDKRVAASGQQIEKAAGEISSGNFVFFLNIPDHFFLLRFFPGYRVVFRQGDCQQDQTPPASDRGVGGFFFKGLPDAGGYRYFNPGFDQ